MKRTIVAVLIFVFGSMSQAEELTQELPKADVSELFQKGQAEHFRQFFTENIEAINRPLVNGFTPLQMAISAGQENHARILLDLGADTKETGLIDISPANLAFHADWQWFLEIALAKEKRTAAHEFFQALEIADEPFAIAVINSSDNYNLNHDGMPALHGALLTNATSVLEHLLASDDLDLEARGPSGLTALQLASLLRNENVIWPLVEKGADINVDLQLGRSPLFLIAGTSGFDHELDEKLSKGLLWLGAEGWHTKLTVTAADLAYARDANNIGNMIEGFIKKTPETAEVISAIVSEDTAALGNLIRQGADLNARTENGWPLTFFAAETGSLESFKILMNNRAPVDGTTEDGSTLMHVLLKSDNTDQWDLRVVIEAISKLPSEKIEKIFFAEDSTGRSAATLVPVYISKSYASKQTILKIPGNIIERMANHSDNDGLSVHIAAVLSENEAMIERLSQVNPGYSSYKNVSLQDIARIKKSWGILHRLPEDRRFSRVFKLGFDKDTARAVQISLKEWGYYEGKIDGALGKGSRAALIAMLTDRYAEMEGIGRSSKFGTMNVFRARGGKDDENVKENYAYEEISKAFVGGNCTWKLVKFKSKTRNEILGCFAGGEHWNSNGFGVRFTDRKPQVVLFGAGGWDGHKPL